MTGAECTCCCYTFKALGKFWWAKFKGQTERPTRPTDLAFVFPFGSPVKLIDFRKPAITGPQGQWGPQVCRYIDAKCWEHNRLRDSLMRLKFYRVVWADQPSFYPWAAQHSKPANVSSYCVSCMSDGECKMFSIVFLQDWEATGRLGGECIRF